MKLIIAAVLVATAFSHWQGLRCDSCGGGPVCGWDETCCSGECVKLKNDPNNCGKCGRVCDSGSCTDGCCTCGTEPIVPEVVTTNSVWLKCKCNQGSPFTIPVCGVCPLTEAERVRRCTLECGNAGAIVSATCTNDGMSTTNINGCNLVPKGANHVACQPFVASFSLYEVCTSLPASSPQLKDLCKNIIGQNAATIRFTENSALCGPGPSEDLQLTGSQLACEKCGLTTQAYFCLVNPDPFASIAAQKAAADAKCKQVCGSNTATGIHWQGACGF